jgi:lysophospholipase L1-like esterase
LQQVLVHSDSLTWGIVPTTRRRLPFDARWPGVMEIAFLDADQHQTLGKALAHCVATLPGILSSAAT